MNLLKLCVLYSRKAGILLKVEAAQGTPDDSAPSTSGTQSGYQKRTRTKKGQGKAYVAAQMIAGVTFDREEGETVEGAPADMKAAVGVLHRASGLDGISHVYSRLAQQGGDRVAEKRL